VLLFKKVGGAGSWSYNFTTNTASFQWSRLRVSKVAVLHPKYLQNGSFLPKFCIFWWKFSVTSNIFSENFPMDQNLRWVTAPMLLARRCCGWRCTSKNNHQQSSTKTMSKALTNPAFQQGTNVQGSLQRQNLSYYVGGWLRTFTLVSQTLFHNA